jgi:MFS family permease
MRISPAVQFLIKNKSLRVPVFRTFLMMRFTLILALQMQAAIISYFVYKLTYNPVTHKGDPVVLGLIGFWEVVPAIGCSLFSGHFVDVNEKKKLISICIFGYLLLSMFFTALALPSVRAFFTVNWLIYLIYGGIFVGGVLRAFASPSFFAMLGALMPKHLYPNSTVWSSASWQTGAVMGPLLGGTLIAIVGFLWSLFAVTAVLIVSFICILLHPRQPVVKKEKEPILKSLAEGIKFVFNKQIMLAVLTLDMFAVLFGGAVALLPVYADDILKVGGVGFGWLRSAPAIGAVLALLIMSFIPVKRNPGIKLYVCFLGFGITTVIFGYCGVIGGTAIIGNFWGMQVSYGFLLAVAMLLLGGMLDSVNIVIRHSILQVYTPDDMRGRVAAVNTIFISSSNELGAMESGLTAKWMGTVPAVVFGGIMTIVTVGVTWFAAPMLRSYNFLTNEKEPNK